MPADEVRKHLFIDAVFVHETGLYIVIGETKKGKLYGGVDDL